MLKYTCNNLHCRIRHGFIFCLSVFLSYEHTGHGIERDKKLFSYDCTRLEEWMLVQLVSRVKSVVRVDNKMIWTSSAIKVGASRYIPLL